MLINTDTQIYNLIKEEEKRQKEIRTYCIRKFYFTYSDVRM